MAKITSGSTFGCTANQVQACSMRADGESIKEIAKVMGVTTRTITNWLCDPKVEKMYRDIIRERLVPLCIKAIKVYEAQIDITPEEAKDYKMGILAQGAARDILNRYGKFISDDDGGQKIQVEITGMPEMGMPDDTN